MSNVVSSWYTCVREKTVRVFFLRRFFIASFVSSSESIGGDLGLLYSGSGDSEMIRIRG